MTPDVIIKPQERVCVFSTVQHFKDNLNKCISHRADSNYEEIHMLSQNPKSRMNIQNTIFLLLLPSHVKVFCDVKLEIVRTHR